MLTLDIFSTLPGTIGGRYMRSFWQPVHRSQDLAPGKARPIRIMGENFALYRGAGGQVHLVEAACPHRGARLYAGWVEGDCIRCQYHGWKYDETGQCIEQPGEKPGFAAKVRVRSYPVQEYLGLIFAYLGEGEARALRRYPELEDGGVLFNDPPEAWPCHWLNRVDNDMAHVPWTHRESLRRAGQDWSRADFRAHTYVETSFGITDPEGIGNAHLFPNMNVLGQPDGTRRLISFVPVDDDNSIAFDLTYAPPGTDAKKLLQKREEDLADYDNDFIIEIAENILAGKMTLQDMPKHLGREQTFMIEDYVSQVGQGRPTERTPEHLGRNDALIILYRKIWMREAKAMAEGRPVKQWASVGIWEHTMKALAV